MKSIQRLIDLTGLSERQIQEFTANGVMKADPSSKELHVDESVKGYIEHLKETSRDDLREEKVFEEHRKLKRENDIAEGVLCNRQDMIRAGIPIITRLSNDLDRVGSICIEAGIDLDPKQVEDVNQYFVKFKNELADLPDKLLTTENPSVD